MKPETKVMLVDLALWAFLLSLVAVTAILTR